MDNTILTEEIILKRSNETSLSTVSYIVIVLVISMFGLLLIEPNLIMKHITKYFYIKYFIHLFLFLYLQVKSLNLWGMNITDISIFSLHSTIFSNLQILNLVQNNITNIDSLIYCTQLKELYLRKNNITDIINLAPLSLLSKLEILWIDDNPITSHSLLRYYLLCICKTLTKLDTWSITNIERKQYDYQQLSNTKEEIKFEELLQKSNTYIQQLHSLSISTTTTTTSTSPDKRSNHELPSTTLSSIIEFKDNIGINNTNTKATNTSGKKETSLSRVPHNGPIRVLHHEGIITNTNSLRNTNPNHHNLDGNS